MAIEQTQEIPIPLSDGQKEKDTIIELLYRGETIKIRRDQLPYRLGRDEDSELFIPAIVASRQHCTVCFEEGRLGILDNSRNGTYVQIGQAKEICVKQEFFPILGKGMLKLGEPVNCGEKNLIFFKCIE